MKKIHAFSQKYTNMLREHCVIIRLKKWLEINDAETIFGLFCVLPISGFLAHGIYVQVECAPQGQQRI